MTRTTQPRDVVRLIVVWMMRLRLRPTTTWARFRTDRNYTLVRGAHTYLMLAPRLRIVRIAAPHVFSVCRHYAYVARKRAPSEGQWRWRSRQESNLHKLAPGASARPLGIWNNGDRGGGRTHNKPSFVDWCSIQIELHGLDHVEVRVDAVNAQRRHPYKYDTYTHGTNTPSSTHGLMGLTWQSLCRHKSNCTASL